MPPIRRRATIRPSASLNAAQGFSGTVSHARISARAASMSASVSPSRTHCSNWCSSATGGGVMRPESSSCASHSRLVSPFAASCSGFGSTAESPWGGRGGSSCSSGLVRFGTVDANSARTLRVPYAYGAGNVPSPCGFVARALRARAFAISRCRIRRPAYSVQSWSQSPSSSSSRSRASTRAATMSDRAFQFAPARTSSGDSGPPCGFASSAQHQSVAMCPMTASSETRSLAATRSTFGCLTSD